MPESVHKSLGWGAQVAEEIASGAAEAADPAGVALALTGASRAEADAYLRDQRHHMHEQLSQLRLDIWEKKLGVLLRLAALLVGLAALIGLLIAMWNASQAEGLVVDAFSVPPALAANGVTADVLSDDLTTRFAAIRDFANEHSLARSKDVNQEQEIKVEIPETGISVTQAWRYLKLWLGHEKRLKGNLHNLSDGRIALAGALDGRDVFVVEGAGTDLNRLEDQAAEKVFAQVDPTNYVIYLSGKGRLGESLAAAARLPELANTPAETSDAYALWSGMTYYAGGDVGLAIARARVAIALDPKTTAPHYQLMVMLADLGHDEDVLVQAGEVASKRKEDEPAWLNSDGVAYAKLLATDLHNTATGDFQQALSETCARRCAITHNWDQIGADLKRAEYAALGHDQKLSRRLAANAAAEGPADPAQQSRTNYFVATAEGDWPAALAAAQADVDAGPGSLYAPAIRNLITATQAMPLLAYARARTGDMAGAHHAIDATPADCYLCLDMRGNVDAVEKNWGGAQSWFARAVAASPSSVRAYADWGSMLLAQGKPDEAIEQFKLANQKGPHFADPIEGWGEALMAKNQSHLALAKFQDAEKYAPNWGRLHLKWGEALVYARKPDEAKAQFAKAVTLDLTPSEKSELAQVSAHG